MPFFDLRLGDLHQTSFFEIHAHTGGTLPRSAKATLGTCRAEFASIKTRRWTSLTDDVDATGTPTRHGGKKRAAARSKNKQPVPQEEKEEQKEIEKEEKEANSDKPIEKERKPDDKPTENGPNPNEGQDKETQPDNKTTENGPNPNEGQGKETGPDNKPPDEGKGKETKPEGKGPNRKIATDQHTQEHHEEEDEHHPKFTMKMYCQPLWHVPKNPDKIELDGRFMVPEGPEHPVGLPPVPFPRRLAEPNMGMPPGMPPPPGSAADLQKKEIMQEVKAELPEPEDPFPPTEGKDDHGEDAHGEVATEQNIGALALLPSCPVWPNELRKRRFDNFL